MASSTRITREQFIIETWEKFGKETIGAAEIVEIQKMITKVFGEFAVDSPASIARILADEGVKLRHPEVLEADTRWREKQFSDLILPHDLSFDSVDAAASSLEKIDNLRKQFELQQDERRLARLVDLVRQIRRESEFLARSRIHENKKRLLAKEVSGWLMIWLQNPKLFPDWLSLRRRSPQFVKEFGE